MVEFLLTLYFGDASSRCDVSKTFKMPSLPRQGDSIDIGQGVSPEFEVEKVYHLLNKGTHEVMCTPSLAEFCHAFLKESSGWKIRRDGEAEIRALLREISGGREDFVFEYWDD